jgi:hypothetical protein
MPLIRQLSNEISMKEINKNNYMEISLDNWRINGIGM